MRRRPGCRTSALLCAALAVALGSAPPVEPAATVALPPTAQTGAAAELSLDSIFTDGAWDAESLPPTRWLDASSYTTLEPSPHVAARVDLVRYEVDGARTVVVAADELAVDFRNDPLLIEDYALSPDGRSLLVFTNSRRVWRARTRGDYWVFDLQRRTLAAIGNGGAATLFASFSPDSQRVAFVRANDLFVQDLRTDVVTRLTVDGSEDVINGTFDWVYEEELFLRQGYRWSPDGRSIVFWQIDTSLVSDFVLVDNTSALYPTVTRFAYPKAGEVNPAARIGVVSSGGGETRWVSFDGSPRDHYLARLDWVPGGREILVQRLNRSQNRNQLYRIDVRRERLVPQPVLEESDEAWVEVHDALHWLDGGRSFTWLSERDGWRRLYRAPLGGGEARPMTPPGIDVMSIEHVAADGSTVDYTAAPDDPTRRYLFRSVIDDAGAIEARRLTPPGGGFHQYRIAPGGRFALHTASSFAVPPRVELVALPDHAVRQTLITNAELAQRVRQLGVVAEMFRVEAGGSELDGWMMRPGELDPGRRYPALFYVYGEPWGQTVLDRWGGRRLLWHRLLNAAGYAVVSVDNRGTPAPRGRGWRKIVHGEIGTLASADQAEAVAALVAREGWLDAERIGIWGWSGGGSMALNALFRYPETYALGISVAPVADQRYYNSIYQERYMGTPQDNPDGYRRGSPISWASRLRGKLLLVHGTGDDNVHYQGTEALIDALVAAGRPFAMMAYPNRSHSISEGGGTTRHLYGTMTDYLLANLPPGGR